MTSPDLIVLLGPTASGKTKLAVALAYALQTEIISADSRQVYKYMNWGTGKDYADYQIHNTSIAYHLIDICEPGDRYHIDTFRNDFAATYKDIKRRGKTPILCGGSGLYIDAIVSNFAFTSIPVNRSLRDALESLTKLELLNRFKEMKPTDFTHLADTSSTKRLIRAIEINTYLLHHDTPVVPPLINKPLILGLSIPVELRRNRIAERLQLRLQNGLIEEVEQLLQKVSPDQLIYYGLEYKFTTEYLLGVYSYTEMVEKLTIAIQQFAKRQMTYFRKMEKDGKRIHWIDASAPVSQQLEKALYLLQQLK